MSKFSQFNPTNVAVIIIFVNHDDPRIIVGLNEFEIFSNLRESSVKIRLLNSVYEFVSAIQEMKLEINLIVSRGSIVEEFQAVSRSFSTDRT